MSEYAEVEKRKKAQSSTQRHKTIPSQSVAFEDNRQSTAQIQSLLQCQPNRTGLPDKLKSGMENLSGKTLDHVKMYYNSEKPAAVQAHATTQGE